MAFRGKFIDYALVIFFFIFGFCFYRSVEIISIGLQPIQIDLPVMKIGQQHNAPSRFLAFVNRDVTEAMALDRIQRSV